MRVTREQANPLFQLISMRYEKASVILTGKYNFYDWGNIIEDKVMAVAIIDRLVHHADIFYINGGSCRVKQKLRKVGANN